MKAAEVDKANKELTLKNGIKLPKYMLDGKRANHLLDTEFFPEGEEDSLLDDESEEEEQEQEDKEATGEEDEDNLKDAHSRRIMYEEAATKFFKLAREGRTYKMRFMVHQNSIQKLDILDEHGQTPLHVAAAGNYPKAVAMLVEQSVFPVESVLNKQDNYGWTPLHYSAFHGAAKILKRLLYEKADSNIQDKHGCTVLHLVASSPKIYFVGLVGSRERALSSVIRQVGAIKAAQSVESGYEVQTSPADDYTPHNGKRKAMTADGLEHVAAKSMFGQYWAQSRMELVMLEMLIKEAKQPKLKIHTRDHEGRTALHYAAYHGHEFAVERLVVAKCRVDDIDRNGRTALSLAVEGDSFKLVDFLLRQKANLEQDDALCRTPLHHALLSKNEDVAKFLLLAEANINAYDAEGQTPWMMALDTRQSHIFRELMLMSPNLDTVDVKGRNLVIASLHAGLLPEVVPVFNSIGPDSAKFLCGWQDPQGYTAMHHAVLMKDIHAVDILFQIDSMLSKKDSNGNTVLHLAAELGHLEIVRKLKEDADTLDLVNEVGETPLHLACHGGHMATVLSFLSETENLECADTNHVDNLGRTILMRACCSGNLSLVNVLLVNMKGDNQNLVIKAHSVNAADKSGCTALVHAVQQGHWYLIPTLVLAGANVHQPDKDCFSPLHWAAYENENATCAALLDMSAEPNQVDKRGWPPLMVAASEGNAAVCQTLLDRNASPYMETHSCETAVGIARRKGAFEIQEMIVTAMRAQEGVLGVGKHLQLVNAEGHFIVSVLYSNGLSIEGKRECMNTYVCLQLQSCHDDSVQGAFTSCMLGQENPQWHESFRFEIKTLDKNAYLLATVVHVPGITKDEVQSAAAAVVKEVDWVEGRHDRRTQKTQARNQTAAEAAFGWDPSKVKNDGLPQNKILSGKELKEFEVKRRRWDSLRVVHQTLRNQGVDVPGLPVPDLHVPLGLTLLRMRSLNEAVTTVKAPVSMNQPLRGCPGAALRLDVDFRPKMWRCNQQMNSADHLRCSTPRNQADEEADIDEVRKKGFRGPINSAPTRTLIY